MIAGTLLPAELLMRLEPLLGEGVTAAARLGGEQRPAACWSLTLRSGRRMFAKIAGTEFAAHAVRLEAAVYESLNGPFMPTFFGWEDHASQPLLLLEDLSAARWPPPWDEALIAEVRSTLDAVHHSAAKLRPFGEPQGFFAGEGWPEVAAKPEPFLSLRLVSAEWLERALPDLLRASAAVDTDGEDVVHFDVRSDNLCRAARGVVLVDWSWAGLGNGTLDTGFWLPSLESEGGPRPEVTLPDRPDIAAWVSGFFAARAGLEQIPDAPHVRVLQRAQLVPALGWAIRALGLPVADASAAHVS
jgi:hypothetical protein